MKTHHYDYKKDKLKAKVLKQAFKALLDDCTVNFTYKGKQIVLTSYDFFSMDEINLIFEDTSLIQKDITAKCLECRNDFIPKMKSHTFCSSECRKKFNSRKHSIDEFEAREKRIFKRKFIDKNHLKEMGVHDLLNEFGDIE